MISFPVADNTSSSCLLYLGRHQIITLLSHIVSPHCVVMHFNKVTHCANEYLQLLEIKCTLGFVVRVRAVICENSCWNSAHSLKATN